jgi:hypothetical protein
MTLFFLILLTVGLTIWIYQRLTRPKPSIKPFFKVEPEPIVFEKPTMPPIFSRPPVTPTPTQKILEELSEPALAPPKPPKTEPPANLPTA